MQWFDAGINCFDQRLPLHQTVNEALAQGVEKLCVIATNENDWPDCIAATQAYPEHLVHTLGVHPHHADGVSGDWVDKLERQLVATSAVAIGECGLDYNRMFSSQSNQLSVFEQQLQLAVKHQLPVYLHERDALNDQLKLLHEYRADLPSGLVHCFTGDSDALHAYMELDLYIGITGWVCDPKRGKALREAVQALPLSRLILETDAPYLFPKTLKPRQSNNHPANLPHIGESLAQILDKPVAEIASHSYTNASHLFSTGKLDTESS